MKKYLFNILLIFPLIMCVSKSQTSFKYNLIFIDSVRTFDKLYYGINESATNLIDTNLGEERLPPFQPPHTFGIFSYFSIPDSTILKGDTTYTKEIEWSYKDFRPFPETDSDIIIYRFTFLADLGKTKSIHWAKFGSEVKSAWITDIDTGIFLKINMMDSTSANVNFDLDDYLIILQFNTKYLSVKSPDNNFQNHPEFYPNPADDFVYLKNDNIPGKYILYNMLGTAVANGEINNYQTVINLNNFSPGIYVALITTVEGKSFSLLLTKK